MHHSFKMSYLEPILVHPVRRQNFGDTVAQKCNPYLIRCHRLNCKINSTNGGTFSKSAGKFFWVFFLVQGT